MAEGTQCTFFHRGNCHIRNIAFSPDSQLLACGTTSCIVYLWDISPAKLNTKLLGHTSVVNSVAFSPNGLSLVSGSADLTARVWSLSSKQQTMVLTGHSDWVRSVAWSPNGDMIASGSYDTTVVLWDANSGSKLKTLKGHINAVLGVVFSQDSNELTTCGGTRAIVWEIKSGTILMEFPHSQVVETVCLSRDEQFVLTGSQDKMIHMFNKKTGHEIKQFVGHTGAVLSISCSIDGSMIVSGSFDNSVRLWDLYSGKQLEKFGRVKIFGLTFDLTAHTKPVASVAFSGNGKYIASGCYGADAIVWKMPTFEKQSAGNRDVSTTSSYLPASQQQQQFVDVDQRCAEAEQTSYINDHSNDSSNNHLLHEGSLRSSSGLRHRQQQKIHVQDN